MLYKQIRHCIWFITLTTLTGCSWPNVKLMGDEYLLSPPKTHEQPQQSINQVPPQPLDSN